ncbi:glycosyltransferase [Caenispirillum salinarum]|uniref:glycosyltransferase family protein n=1 Tax=Caenispirillum salinarum TaxID=859058 RepID=UPI00384CB2DA
MLRAKGAGHFGVSFKLSNGLVRAGHFVLNFSDRDIARASTIFRTTKAGIGGVNRTLLEVAQDYHPDLILFGHADTIRRQTLEALREKLPQAILAQWNVDPLFEADNVARINSKIDLVDWTFVSTAGSMLRDLAADSHRVAFLPNPVDPSIERARCFEMDREALPHDLFFPAGLGTQERFHAGRMTCGNEIADRIHERMPDLRCDLPGVNGAPRKFGRPYEIALSSAAMGLNLSRRNDVHLYTSDRMAHLCGSGLLTFIDRATGYGELFDESELGFYSTEDELLQRIAAFRADDATRRRVAEAGWRAYRTMFDATRISAYMIDVMYESVDPWAFRWAR